MKAEQFDVTPFLTQDEGQHFDRKSLFEGAPGKKRPRNRRAVRDHVAEYVAGFANAEGGVLILGLEDDGTVTGHGYPADVVDSLLNVPQTRLRPPAERGFQVRCGDHELLVYEVVAADAPVMVEGNGFPLRVGSSTVKVEESKVSELKLAGLVESWEARPSPCTLSHLDSDLLRRAKQGAGLEAIGDEAYLLHRKLADRRGRQLRLRRAAELLFAAHPEHPNAGVRIFRVIGTERRHGADNNVEERPRVEGPLPQVVEQASAEIARFLRRPARLVGARFRETPEYPEFSWKEALLNAIAHRDYSVEGRAVEVWLYDDRMEVISPGGLVAGITVEDLSSLERHHVSRNPRIVRCLVDLGAMRDQGEGIPRMFAEMEALFLPAPSLRAERGSFRLTLRNTPTLTAQDKDFVASLGSESFTDDEVRALLEAHRNGRIDNSRMRVIAGLDTLGASSILRKLRDRGWLQLHGAGSASFYSLPDRGELDLDRGELGADRGELGADRGELEGSRPLGRALPPELQELVKQLGARPRSDKLRRVLQRLLEHRAFSPTELGALLSRDPAKLTERHLAPMVGEGLLERTHPDNPTHPEQKYRARQTPLPSDEKSW